MNKILSIFFIFLSFTATTQNLSRYYFPSNEINHRIELRFDGYYQSHSFTNEFLGKFYKGGFIDSTLKDNIASQLFNDNRFGAELQYGILYENHHTHLLGKPLWGWYTGIENVLFAHGSLSENAFNLIFYGNGPFVGDTLPLGNNQGAFYQYQKFTIGGFHKTNHSKIGISFLKGQNYGEMNLSNSNIYTETFGNSIYTELQGNFIQADTNSRNLSSFNGWGISTDLIFYLNTGKNKNVKFENAFCIAIENLGFIQWKKAIQSTIDTTILFEGIEVNDLFDSTSYQINYAIRDSLGIKDSKIATTTCLPFSFSFGKIVDPNSIQKIQGFYGVRLRYNANYKPLFYAGIHYKPIDDLFINANIAFGGYGKLKIGFQLGYTIMKNLYLHLGAGNLTGFTKNGYGQEIFGRVSYAF